MQAVKQAQQHKDSHNHSKSPPSSTKNLQHVPCRFYRSGQCTAGRNCVFSHDLQQETERAPCKYFQKGNCRFGAKCALAHILPDGRRVNHNHNARGPTFGRINPENRQFQHSGIHAELLQSHQDQMSSSGDQRAEFPALSQSRQQIARIEDSDAASASRQSVGDRQNQQSSDSVHESRNGYHVKEGEAAHRVEDNSRPPLQSPDKTLGPLDAQLPASLDSNGISWFARHGPVAASVPHTRQFGIPEHLTSYPSSPLPGYSIQPSTSLFAPNLGTSPRNTTLGRAMFERRVSAINHRDEDSGEFVFEEDFVPSSLSELLTPAERQRRDSKTNEDLMSKSPTGSTTGGSPSSSRFGALFLKNKAAVSSTSDPKSSPIQPILPIGSPLARNAANLGTVSMSGIVSPPRLGRSSSALRISDMNASAKEFNYTSTATTIVPVTSSMAPDRSIASTTDAASSSSPLRARGTPKESSEDFKTEEETFEMDI